MANQLSIALMTLFFMSGEKSNSVKLFLFLLNEVLRFALISACAAFAAKCKTYLISCTEVRSPRAQAF